MRTFIRPLLLLLLLLLQLLVAVAFFLPLLGKQLSVVVFIVFAAHRRPPAFEAHRVRRYVTKEHRWLRVGGEHDADHARRVLVDGVGDEHRTLPPILPGPPASSSSSCSSSSGSSWAPPTGDNEAVAP